MIAIIDYGMGNLYSVKNALDYLGIDAVISGEIDTIRKADGLILPGVGAFPDAMDTLEKSGLAQEIVTLAKQGKPLLGICLGMQLLLEEGYEVTKCKGLGLIGGKCIRIDAPSLKIPHIGWNNLTYNDALCPLLKGVEEGSYVYFVHSFRAQTSDDKSVIAYTEYGEKIPAIIGNGNVFGTQFHPEKSEKVGLKMLSNFAEFVKARSK